MNNLKTLSLILSGSAISKTVISCSLQSTSPLYIEKTLGDNPANSKKGNNTFIGMNATIRQGLVIGSNSVIGAGAVVTKNVKNNVIVVGNPAFELKKNI